MLPITTNLYISCISPKVKSTSVSSYASDVYSIQSPPGRWLWPPLHPQVRTRALQVLGGGQQLQLQSAEVLRASLSGIDLLKEDEPNLKNKPSSVWPLLCLNLPVNVFLQFVISSSLYFWFLGKRGSFPLLALHNAILQETQSYR